MHVSQTRVEAEEFELSGRKRDYRMDQGRKMVDRHRVSNGRGGTGMVKNIGARIGVTRQTV